MRLLDNIRLKQQEKKWGLYDTIPQLEIEYTFAFIDQFQTGGHFNTQIVTVVEDDIYNRSIININLSNKTNEDVIVFVIHHEALHVAIASCIINQDYDFIENVINKWIIGKDICQNGITGDIYVQEIGDKK